MNPEFHAHALTSPELSIVVLSAAGVAVLHTLAGPDHYLPFIVLSRARRWSRWRTAGWTAVCGLGHVGSSLVLAVAGVVFGYGLEHVRFVEEIRGNVAAWAMIAFGLVYAVWGLKRAARGVRHGHRHAPDDGGPVRVSDHRAPEQAHAHGEAEGFRMTPWILFTIFVFGPCEPMIPIVMYPAAQGAWHDVWTVAAVFAALTIAAMLAVVLLAGQGLRLLPARALERYHHALAGGTILLAGCAIQFLGL
jgi:hypothetical protein